MVRDTFFPAVHILGTYNVRSRAKGTADHYWPTEGGISLTVQLRFEYNSILQYLRAYFLILGHTSILVGIVRLSTAYLHTSILDGLWRTVWHTRYLTV